MSSFIIQLHHSACHEGLRDKTRGIIHEFWSRAADIKTEIMAGNTSSGGAGVDKYQDSLMSDLEKVYSRSLKDGESYLGDYYLQIYVKS